MLLKAGLPLRQFRYFCRYYTESANVRSNIQSSRIEAHDVSAHRSDPHQHDVQRQETG